MNDLLGPLVIAIAGGATLLLAARWDALAPPSVLAWSKIARNHGLIDSRPLMERIGVHIPALRILYREANVPRLLMLAGRDEGSTAWATRAAGVGLLAAAAGLGTDWLAGAGGILPLPPGAVLLAIPLCPAVAYLRLQRQAHARQAHLELALSQSLSELAILTFSGQVSIESALEMVSRAHADPALHDLLRSDRWRRLVEEPEGAGDAPSLTSTPAIYERIGIAYEVPTFGLLAAGMRRMNEKGLPARRMLTNLARSVGQAKLAEMAVRTERARVRLAIPIGLMVLPLLTVIGYPTAVAIGSGLNR